MRSRLILRAVTCFLVGIPSSNVFSNDLDDLHHTLVDYFRPQMMLPILVDRGYEVGTVLDSDGITVLQRAKECFRGLKPVEKSVDLPDVIHTSSKAAGLGVRLQNLFNLEGGGALDSNYEIKFTDVKIKTVTAAELLVALDKKVCPALEGILKGVAVGKKNIQPPALIIANVFEGSRKVILKLGAKGNVHAEVDRIRKVIGDANVDLAAAGEGHVVLASKTRTVIAVGLARVPSLMVSKQLGGHPSNADPEILGQEWLDPNTPKGNSAFLTFSKQLPTPKLSNMELEQ